MGGYLQAKLENLKEEKEREVKTLLTRCQEAEKKKQLEGAAINVAQLAIANAGDNAGHSVCLGLNQSLLQF